MVRAATREGTGHRFEPQHHVDFRVKNHVTCDVRPCGWLVGPSWDLKKMLFLFDFGISKNLYHHRLVTRTGGDKISSPPVS